MLSAFYTGAIIQIVRHVAYHIGKQRNDGEGPVDIKNAAVTGGVFKA